MGQDVYHCGVAMTLFRRAGTWGEHHPLITSWGLIDAVWGGVLITQSELALLGTVLCDVTPAENIYMDLTPTESIRLNITPAVVIEYVNAPEETIQLDLTPSVSVQLEAGWGV